VTGQRRVAGAGDYVRGLEDTAPLDVVDRPGRASDEDVTGDGWTPVIALDQRVQVARGRQALQDDPALLAALSDKELAADRKLVEWERARRRKHRRGQVKHELGRDAKDVKAADRTRNDEASDRLWHRRALAARRRVTNPDARLAKLYRRSELSSRALVAVVIVGMAWSGVNVQHNLAPAGDVTNPLFWLGYGIDALISVPLIVTMVQATTAASWGRDVKRAQIIGLEVGLLLMMIGLNAGPLLVAGHLTKAAEYAVAPTMVGVVIWLHAWTSARYSELIAGVHVPGEQEAGRLGEDTADLLDAVVRVQAAMKSGLLKPSELNTASEVAPSSTRIAAVFGIRKADAIIIREAINRLAKEPAA
jgi:hypothetical protein